MRTVVTTAGRGPLAFQEYLVRGRGRGRVTTRPARHREGAAGTRLAALRRADAIVLPPSNPRVSIGPILELPVSALPCAGRAGASSPSAPSSAASPSKDRCTACSPASGTRCRRSAWRGSTRTPLRLRPRPARREARAALTRVVAPRHHRDTGAHDTQHEPPGAPNALRALRELDA